MDARGPRRAQEGDGARVLIARCAWHVKFGGRWKRWLRVVEWRGWRIRFSDGLCPACAPKFRAASGLRKGAA